MKYIEILIYCMIATSVGCFLWMAGHLIAEEIIDIWKKLTYNKRMNQELQKLIADAKGKFFSITFVKKDGTVRIINGKNKYKRLMSDRSDGVKHKNYVREAGYLSAVNRNREQWFSFKPTETLHFKCGNIEKTFVRR